MGKPWQRAVDILGLQHQSGRCGSRASGRASKESIANGGRPTASGGPFDSTNSGKRSSLFGELAETEGHHPDISFGWGYATVSLSIEKIKGLPVKDFIMASGCSIARIGPSTSSSEKLRHELANLNHDTNLPCHLRIIVVRAFTERRTGRAPNLGAGCCSSPAACLPPPCR